MPIVKVILKKSRTVHQLKRKVGDTVLVRSEIAKRWADRGICEYPVTEVKKEFRKKKKD